MMLKNGGLWMNRKVMEMKNRLIKTLNFFIIIYLFPCKILGFMMTFFLVIKHGIKIIPIIISDTDRFTGLIPNYMYHLFCVLFWALTFKLIFQFL